MGHLVYISVSHLRSQYFYIYLVYVTHLCVSFPQVQYANCKANTVNGKYTMGHKSAAFSTITPMFLGGFLHILYHRKEE